MGIGQLSRFDLVTAALTDSLNQAASWMRYADVGALPVLEAGEFMGQPYRARPDPRRGGLDPRNHAVAAFMSLGPVTADPDQDSDHVALRMLELGIRHLPVLEQGKHAKIVSMRDLFLTLRRRSDVS